MGNLAAGAALRQHPVGLWAPMVWFGALTLVFAFDDLFLLHEIFIPWGFGLPEIVTYSVYGVVLVSVLLRYRVVLLRQPEASVLLMALIALGGSVALDVLGWDSTIRRLVEEGLKLLGSLAWAVFPARLMVRAVTSQRPGANDGCGTGVE